MAINDSPNKRRLSKGFNIKPWKAKSPWKNAKDREELLIRNYPQEYIHKRVSLHGGLVPQNIAQNTVFNGFSQYVHKTSVNMSRGV
jgi:hypothetical protein